jgi:prepilin peptidase CpaA
MSSEMILLLALMPVIAFSAISDLRTLKISNLQVLTALALFVLFAPFLLDSGDLSMRLLVGAATFVIGFVLFAMRVIGGGDAKMMPAVMLFVPSDEVVLFLRIFAVTLGTVSLCMLVFQRTPAFRRIGWSSLQEQRHVPVGVAIAISVALLALLISNS